MKTPKELQVLKEKMLALQAGNFEVEADNPKIVKCWERLSCTKTDCPAYGKLRCWSIAGTCCHSKVQGELAKKLGDCKQCVVYKESCGDEISEFVEVFNQMVKDIKFNLSEQERSDKEKARDERTAELGNMIASVAHETRNPLHSIGIAASYLKKNFHGELMTEFLNVIEAEVGKLNALTSIFLSFSSPVPLALEECQLNDLVLSAIADFRHGPVKPPHAFAMALDESLPLVKSDPARVREAVVKLLENAVEAMPEGGEVLVGTKLAGEEVQIFVTDHGPGITPELRGEIFKPFYTTKTNGPGLGLAIVERNVRELCGQVSLTSEPGKGATFIIHLPVGG